MRPELTLFFSSSPFFRVFPCRVVYFQKLVLRRLSDLSLTYGRYESLVFRISGTEIFYLSVFPSEIGSIYDFM